MHEHDDETRVLSTSDLPAHSQGTHDHEHTWPEADPDLEVGVAASGNGKPTSVLDALRAVRERQAVEHTLDLEVPGWTGLLALRLGPIPAVQIARIADRVQSSRSPERAFNANADMLIAATRAVLGRASRSGEWEVLPGDNGEPLLLGEELAEKLGLRATRARDLVRELYDRANAPDLALGSAANDYIEWATTTNEELDDSMLGESPAAPR